MLLYVSVEGNIFNNAAECVLLMFVKDKYVKDTSVYPAFRFFKICFTFRLDWPLLLFLILFCLF